MAGRDPEIHIRTSADTSDLDKLDKKIEKSQGTIRELAKQIANTDDKAKRADLEKAFGDERRTVAKLRRIRNALDEVGDEATEAARKAAAVGVGVGGPGRPRRAAGAVAGLAGAGTQLAAAGARAAGSAGSAGGALVSALPPPAQVAIAAALVAAAAAAAPAMGAAVVSGILLALGGGVLAAGIVAAARDPKVAAAWAQFGERAKTAFAKFGGPFKAPMIRAADTFGDSLERMSPSINALGASFAPLVDQLAPAFAQMAEKALPGLIAAAEAAKPLFSLLAEHAPKIGEALGKFFEEIAKGAPGAKVFFGLLLIAVEKILPLLGTALAMLANEFGRSMAAAGVMAAAVVTAFQWLGRTAIDAIGAIIIAAASAFGWLPGLGPKLKEAAAKFEEFRIRANEALGGIESRTVHVDVQLRGIKNLSEQAAVRLGRRQHGGPVTAGQPYIVGERQAELFVPTTNGVVLPQVPPVVPEAGGRGAAAMRQPIQVQLVVSGKVLAEVLTEYAVSTGRSPTDLWSAARR